MTTERSKPMPELRAQALSSPAWPFAEARKLVERIGGETPEKGYVLFETGYGPSGLPHLGTFGEVSRTTMVRHAFEMICDVPTRLICFSDDMDGLRKVPGNVPNGDQMQAHIGQPLTQVPDPFGTHPSFGEHNNARLMAFLDQFGFQYEFLSATECYQSGRFDETLLHILRNYEKVERVILPTLGEERRKTYSPFLPVCPKTGVVLQVPLLDRDPDAGTITFEDSEGERHTVSVTGGNVKCQWKVDWAMRWHALDVDYEMSGKDLIESVKLSGAIRRILGGKPPEGFTYELFLDDKGEKISKTKGNGLTIEEWLEYASPESLSLYMFRSPRKAKRLHFDVIPKTVDEYYDFLDRFRAQEIDKQLANPVFHVHQGEVPEFDLPLTFSLLLNLVSVAHAENKESLWSYVGRYAKDASAQSHPELDRLMGYALAYYRDHVAANKRYRKPSAIEAEAMRDLQGTLAAMPDGASAEEFQTEVYEVGKRYDFESLRQWFKALYECLLGQSQGPRMGSFVALYGRDETIGLIEQALRGALVGE